MKTLLDWLFGFFILGIVDGEGEGEGDGEGAGEDAGDAGAGEGEGDGSDAGEGDGGSEEGDDLGIDVGAGDDDGVAAAAAQAAREVKEANERAQRLQTELDAVRRQSGPAHVTDEQRMIAEEDAKLRDAKTTDLERWQIASNRTLRENKRTSMTALAQAQDLNDRTAFSSLAVTKPALHKRYADRVETEINRMRQAGQTPPPREALMTYMIGKDAMDGKLTPQKKAAAASTIDRGKSPGARSDVAAKGRLTEAQKREKRLENATL